MKRNQFDLFCGSKKFKSIPNNKLYYEAAFENVPYILCIYL